MLCLGLLACGVAGVVPVSAAARRSFKTPGYRWNHKLPKVAPVVPGRLLTLGDGEYPHVLVDAAGTGQIAYTTSSERRSVGSTRLRTVARPDGVCGELGPGAG